MSAPPVRASELPPPVPQQLRVDVETKNVLIDAEIWLRRARRDNARHRRQMVDALIFRCPGCDARVLPKRLMTAPHECTRTATSLLRKAA